MAWKQWSWDFPSQIPKFTFLPLNHQKYINNLIFLVLKLALHTH